MAVITSVAFTLCCWLVVDSPHWMVSLILNHCAFTLALIHLGFTLLDLIHLVGSSLNGVTTGTSTPQAVRSAQKLITLNTIPEVIYFHFFLLLLLTKVMDNPRSNYKLLERENVISFLYLQIYLFNEDQQVIFTFALSTDDVRKIEEDFKAYVPSHVDFLHP